MADGPWDQDTGELVSWVTELQLGRPDAADPVCRMIVARVEELVRAMFRRFPRLGRFVDADDVVQNVLIRLLNTCRSTRPSSPRHFFALTGELIRRELLDLTRRYFGPRGDGANRADVVVGDGDREYDPADRAPEPAELERAAAFHRAVAGLPAREREVIGLAYYHGRTQPEIATLLGVTTRTVQRWHESGVALLRQKLAAGDAPGAATGHPGRATPPVA